MTTIETGDIWVATLDPTVGREQSGRRPVVVVSANAMHALPINMAVVVPLTGNDRGLVTQPRVSSRASGLNRPSFACPEDVRAIDASRLGRRLGRVSADELDDIRKVLRYFLDL
ncbi:type II toxin-antitoxin system PemK/MazF family toxin [Asanoa sp. WMMD1127]|uniref:type II toxin-antitoxin system PemK/MazF family toxin n=1 Tax=Asanoa sp. WMMD1127 TaxID=3016107 RepID=UPI002416318F|nr:type II toxin-antitoxin system PemK/MazF family toxin [Asanoa sp. WMMD1127]MDG4826892.1 type II toxin-antitoxin system PemK/MazF family toxin [Asanoa sp. WMMD1127]